MCSELIARMRSGGYYDRIMRAGPELDRVKEFLEIMAGERPEVCQDDLQRPNFPCFPGLPVVRTVPTDSVAIAARLERQAENIIEECTRLSENDYVWYAPSGAQRTWAIYFFFHMGVDFEQLTRKCPRTFELIRSLPRVAFDYPWADAILSLQAPDSVLRPHCSVDNLRLRCHLGIDVPPGCGMRVGHERIEWQRGKALFFNDAIEHEVWNRSNCSRVVLILDTWNPGLTDSEIRAITAGFRKREARETFCHMRLSHTTAPPAFYEHLDRQVCAQEADPLIREFWNA